MIRTLSQTEIARRDTLIKRCDDDRLDRLSRYYGLTRPVSYPIDAWRNLMINVVYQPRGTLRTLFTALDALFAPWRDHTARAVSIASKGSVTDATMTTNHAHRWVRIENNAGARFSWLETFTPATNTAQLNINQMCYWDAWDTAVDGVLSFLPFLIVEGNASLKIRIDATLFSTPPTYKQNAGATRPTGQPFGGHLLNLLDLDPTTENFGDQINGAFPLYLTGENASGVLGDLLRRLIPAGVRVQIEAVRYGVDIGYPALSELAQKGSL